MENNYLLAPSINKLLNVYAANPLGSLLISGPRESDLPSVLKYLLYQIYGEQIKAGQVYYLEQKTIEAVRQLLASLCKTRFDETKPRMIVIDNCDKLEVVAQNALLKGLEEPPAGSHFLLTSNREWNILPTILSRCQQIKMQKPSKEALLNIYSNYSEEEFNQAYWATDGWPADMQAFLTQPESKIHQEINLAKKFLQLNPVEKTKYLFDKNAPSQKEDLSKFLEVLLNGLWRTARAALLLAASKNDSRNTDLWRKKFLIINDLKNDFDKNLNRKIIMLNLNSKL